MRTTALVLAVFLSLDTPASAQIRAHVFATGLTAPLQFVPDPLSADTVYIVEQGGLVKTLRGGIIVDPFVDLRGAISTGGERGLLGMAFDPNAASGRVFFNFTDTNGHTVVARFRRAAGAPLRVDPASRFDLRWPGGERFIRQPFANHNGGNLAFGPDGYLYIGLGDGGSGDDPQNNAQNPASLLGKMLRLDVAVDDADPVGYRVPPSNPFLDGQPIAALGEIWDVGLRNPWRYSFDDVGAGATGALIIADVGQGAREEINYEPFGAGGRNYGWRLREGRIATPGIPATTAAFTPLAEPIFDYERSAGQAITGGYVYRGTALGAAYRGRYFFADFVSSRVWSLGLAVNPSTGEATAAGLVEHTAELGGSLGGIASFGRDSSGELYLLTFGGRVLKLVGESAGAPNPPESVTATVSGSRAVVSWMPPSAGPAAAAFQLEAGSAPGAANLGLAVASGAQTSLTFDSVPAGTYFVRVRSLGSAGAGVASPDLVVIVGGAGCTQPPAAPTQLASAVDGPTVSLSWLAGVQVDAPSAFQIEAGRTSGSSDLGTILADGTLRALAVQAPPGVYFVRIRGVNGCGPSAASNEIVVTVF